MTTFNAYLSKDFVSVCMDEFFMTKTIQMHHLKHFLFAFLIIK